MRVKKREGEKRKSVKQEKRNPQHRHEGLGTMLRKILEAQHRNGGLGAMLKTILEAAAVLLRLFLVLVNLTFLS